VATQLGLPGLPGQSRPQAPAPAAQPAPAPPAPAATAKASYGLGNIKSFSFDGPLAMTVAVAKDASAGKPDLTAGMAFTGLDWKVTKVVPHF
jgi:hypothetical protein